MREKRECIKNQLIGEASQQDLVKFQTGLAIV